jgi:hypothetical protein
MDSAICARMALLLAPGTNDDHHGDKLRFERILVRYGGGVLILSLEVFSSVRSQ